VRLALPLRLTARSTNAFCCCRLHSITLFRNSSNLQARCQTDTKSMKLVISKRENISFEPDDGVCHCLTDGAACPPMRSLISRERCTTPTVGCHTFHWQATEWSACRARQGSPRCGRDVGIQQRDVFCADSSENRVPVKRYSVLYARAHFVTTRFAIDGTGLLTILCHLPVVTQSYMA